MTEKEREEVVKMLKAFGWSENRCVDTSNFRYELMDDPDNEFLGEKFCLFKTAEDFLSNFGGLKLEWNHENDNYDYEMTFNGRVCTRILYLKWYIAYFRCMLYPVGEYPALPGELFIDEQGYFYIARDTFVRKLGNDIFEILYDFIFLNKMRVYKEISHWEDAGYSDEFMEQWNYDFDELDKIKQDKKQKILNFLKANGWSENRCVDSSNFKYDLVEDPDNEFLGEKFCLFKTAEDFLSNFGGLKLQWKHENNNYNFKMTFDGRTNTQVLYLKWYIAYFRCMLYPVGEYPALPGELFIDEQGYFYIAQDTFVGKLGNDIFDILYDFIFLNKKRVYKKIAYWEDAGYSDEFMEQWNYDFDELDKMKQE